MSVPIVVDNLELQFVGASKIELLGSLNSERAQSELASRFQSIHQDILKIKLPSFVVDVRGLRLANSSAIRLFVDPVERLLEIFRLENGQYVVAGAFSDEALIRAEPFDAIELELGAL